ncbi:MAG: regulatory protein RecX [Clostridia bacterium]|nr:regulatory protein RecX [Clostridia bacterium]
MSTHEDTRLTIVSVTPKRGRQYTLALSDGSKVPVDKATFDQSPYRADSALTTDELSALLSLSAENRAREKALWLLSHRDYSRRELAQKLRDGGDRETADKTAARMEEIGLVNDRRYAEKWARELCFVKHYPARRAVMKLLEKGVPREVAEAAIAEIEPDDVTSALAFLHKKCYTADQDEKARQKIYGALLRYGFDGETIRSALRRFEPDK